jgi:hypothetical protein
VQGVRNRANPYHGSVVDQPLCWPKGSTWLLRRTDLHVHARYLPPLALDPVRAR